MQGRIFEIIQPDQKNDRASVTFDYVITALILFCVVSVFVGTFKLSDRVRGVLEIFDAVVSVVFTIEYALRIWGGSAQRLSFSTMMQERRRAGIVRSCCSAFRRG